MAKEKEPLQLVAVVLLGNRLHICLVAFGSAVPQRFGFAAAVAADVADDWPVAEPGTAPLPDAPVQMPAAVVDYRTDPA